MSEISATISNFVDSADKIYSLAMRIKDDLSNYSEKKERKKVKLQIEQARDLVGTIDLMISKLVARLEIMRRTGQISMFPKHKSEFKMVFNKIESLSSQMDKIMELSKFNVWPDLRKFLIEKSEWDAAPYYQSIGGEETEDQMEDSPPKHSDEKEVMEDFESFESYVKETHEINRKALDELNYYLESKI